ncbi:MAG: aldo/keto reductase [Synergistaceae bacterium]|nr:aldo/keto reductase [Synergistaceae bacterium]
MEKMRLGRTDLLVTRTSFGALPIQRTTMEEAKKILLKAYESGINFYDTARMYTDSEEKIGSALSKYRHDVIIATKSVAREGGELIKDLELSLRVLKTDYIDIYQCHFCKVLPLPDDGTQVYETLLKVKEQGKIRFIGVTSHDINVVMQGAKSGLYDTVQYPLSCLSVERDLDIIPICREHDVGLIAMKAMSGGLIRNRRAAFAFIRAHDIVVPIWGVQKIEELEEWLSYENNPPILDAKLLEEIELEKAELGSSFCRGCGYCMPCPVGIQIATCARMKHFLGRMPTELYITPEWRYNMALIDECLHCDSCKNKCPYNLDTPALLAENNKFYNEFIACRDSKMNADWSDKR